MRIHPSHILVYYIILPYDYNLYLPRGGDLIHTARDLRVSLGLTILGPTPLGSLISSGIHKWSPTHLTVWYITVLVVNWHVHCQCHAPLSITRTSSSITSYVCNLIINFLLLVHLILFREVALLKFSPIYDPENLNLWG